MRSREGTRQRGLFFGLALIVLGTLLTLDRLGFADANAYWAYWPLLLVALGLGRLVGPVGPDERRHGGWLVFIGGVLLLHTLHLFRLHDSWPLFVVAAGVSWIWGGWRGEVRTRRRGDAHDA
jgi:hypothetical protein